MKENNDEKATKKKAQKRLKLFSTTQIFKIKPDKFFKLRKHRFRLS